MSLLRYTLFWTLLLFQVAGLAHVDPVGDVHPRIVIEGKNFSILFGNNKENRPPYSDVTKTYWFESWMNVYKTVISSGGKVLENRVKTENPKVIPRKTYWTDDGRIRIVEGGKENLITPKWPKKIEYIQDVVWSGNKVWAVFSYPSDGSPFDGSSSWLIYPFFFVAIDRDAGAISVSEPIGNPSRIYDFPVASHMIQLGHYLYIVWAQEIPDGKVDVEIKGEGTVKMDTFRADLILSRYDTNTGKLKHSVIEKLKSTNIHIDIAEIESKMLIAHHDEGKINWRIVDLASQPFSEKIKIEQDGGGKRDK